MHFAENTAAKVVKSLMDRDHELFIFSNSLTGTLSGDITWLDADTGHLTICADSRGRDISHYSRDGRLSFDIEVKDDDGGAEIFNFERVSAITIKRDHHLYEFQCQLPDSVLLNDNRDAIRIPFILGMQARVNCEVYEDELNIKGKLRNLSIGGCMIDIAIEDSAALRVDQVIPRVLIDFPNGTSISTKGLIRHIRPFGSSTHAAVGLQFIEKDHALDEHLFHVVAEAEREVAIRTGMNPEAGAGSPLFIAGKKEKQIMRREAQDKAKHANQPPMTRGVKELAKQLHIILMFLKNQNTFPEDTLYDCVDTLLLLVNKDRKQLLYALSLLRNEAEWVRHAIQVTATLADFMIGRDPHSPYIRESVAGALIHTMGKPLMLGPQLPTLKANMTPDQKTLLKGHTTTLLETLDTAGWQPSQLCRNVLENSNERLDGSGYPNGKTDQDLNDTARLIGLIKAINKLMHPRNGAAPRAPLDAYRWVSDHDEQYDKALLVEYIQIYGLYPIGCLAQFSRGFLAWIIDTDNKGMPTRVNVVKNLAFPNTAISTELEAHDFMQIGKFEGIANPDDYDIVLKE
ncbi:PilZ domain-containing protein [Aidingimonas halophila]|uniref:HD domain-containing protein n=1 Tax=Aidingimonas halophila TaxID=574349 RepID=A0A1H3D5G1_9GAMM|nr:PilZ domain-containing protein [Aidingimonas halophila]GHC30490.1 hypothetical protein GCM10008094_23510 [Aidingimonas halophila]SDX61742.1 HD domain-containing protein [Aidingimonas halophila]